MLALTHPAPGQSLLLEHPDPVPGPGEILVRVHAAGLNRADLLQKAGKYPAPPGWPADIPGLEYAGEVMALGEGAARWAIGDRVMGLVGGGAHAERVVVHEDEAMAVPPGMAWTEAAAIPEAFLTAWDALVLRGRVGGGERVLCHAVGSGVGTAAVQLARLLDATLIGTSRTPDKLARCAAMGMPHGVVTTEGDWPLQVGGAVDVIIDALGAKFLDQNLNLLAPRGRLVVLGTLTGGVAERLDMSLVLRRRLELIGTAMRSRDLTERRELVARFALEVLPHFISGALRPVVDRVVPLAEFEVAHAAMAENATFGKVILEVNRER
jgi:putative PIG3 family NAD(P)H quinone oxidoreductase